MNDLFKEMNLPPTPDFPSAPSTPAPSQSPEWRPVPQWRPPSAPQRNPIQEIMSQLLRDPEMAMQILQTAGMDSGAPMPPKGAPPFDPSNLPPMPTMPGKVPV